MSRVVGCLAFVVVLATGVFVMPAVVSTTAMAAVSDQGAERVLSLEEALELARTESHQVRQARADLERSALSVSEARAGRLPSVDVEGRYTNNLALPAMVLPADSPFGEQVIRTGSRHNFSGGVQVGVPIYSAQLNRSIELSQAVEALEQVLSQATVREVELEVQRAYLNSLLSEEAHQVLVLSHETLGENLSLIRSLYEEGLAPEYDLVRSEVQVRNLEPEMARARNNHEQTLNYLKLLVGIPIEEEITLSDSLVTLYQAVESREFAAQFEQNRDLLQVEGQQGLLEHQLSMEQATYWPTVAAFGNFNYQGQGDDLRFWDYNWLETAMVGVSVTVPLFSPGRRQRIEQVQVEQRQAQMQRDFLLESLRAQYQTTQRRLRELEATIAAQERNIAQAERGYTIARASFEEGVHSLMEVNDAESALREARLNYQTALGDYVNAVLDMEELLGRSSRQEGN